MAFLNSSDEILSVGEFSRRLKTLLKVSIPELWLRGEVSNLKTYSSGHTYFTLKDEAGAISAVLFKGYAQSMSMRLSEGMRVLIYGEISLYEVRGSYQIVVKAMMPDGVGDLAARFEELKRKLASEGLFDESKKREIPKLPQRIAVVTSPTGAAIRDFISILRRRAWRGEVVILPSKVQGVGAAEEIVDAIKIAQKEDFDLLILMRGGGSLEDLWSFNEEIVARAVASSKIPTISAVGHEIDFTLSDFASDLRAETPSAAAEYISSSFIQIRDDIEGTYQDISALVMQMIGAFKERLAAMVQLFNASSPKDKINNFAMALDEAESRLNSLALNGISQKKAELLELEGSLKAFSIDSKIDLFKHMVESAEKQLELLSVDSVLRRGFAFAQSQDGKFIKRKKDAPKSESFKIRFFDGEIKVSQSDTNR